MEHRFEVFENAEVFFFMMRLVLGHKHPEPIFLKLMTLPSKGDFLELRSYLIILSKSISLRLFS